MCQNCNINRLVISASGAKSRAHRSHDISHRMNTSMNSLGQLTACLCLFLLVLGSNQTARGASALHLADQDSIQPEVRTGGSAGSECDDDPPDDGGNESDSQKPDVGATVTPPEDSKRDSGSTGSHESQDSPANKTPSQPAAEGGAR
jgi:hypothetical protein